MHTSGQPRLERIAGPDALLKCVYDFTKPYRKDIAGIRLSCNSDAFDTIICTVKVAANSPAVASLIGGFALDASLVCREIHPVSADFRCQHRLNGELQQPYCTCGDGPAQSLDEWRARNYSGTEKTGWDPSFSVGNAAIDKQHQRLLAVCLRAADCLLDDSADSKKRFHIILWDLSAYAKEHFAAEEALLRKHDCPRFAEHKAEHGEYLKKLIALLLATNTDTVDKEALQQFLSVWWTRHVLESDLECKPFLQAS